MHRGSSPWIAIDRVATPELWLKAPAMLFMIHTDYPIILCRNPVAELVTV